MVEVLSREIFKAESQDVQWWEDDWMGSGGKIDPSRNDRGIIADGILAVKKEAVTRGLCVGYALA
jgi:hypothetical protein